jgi:hypothetical protein
MKGLFNRLFKEKLGVTYNPTKQRYEMVQYGDEKFIFNSKTNKIVKHF